MQDKEEVEKKLELSKTAFLGNFPPYECGIATFTEDLVNAMNKRFNPKLKSRVVALNDDGEFCNYNKKVILEINREDMEDYILKAKQINNSQDIKIVCIQHEFGIFGGEYGNYLIPFLEALEKPVVITFHSVLPDPDEKRKRLVKFICSKSSAVIVMAKSAIDILEKDYGVDREKVHFVPHGIPSTSFKSTKKYKKKLGLDGRIILSTFGLLSSGKGIEYVIRALPNIVKQYPNLTYLIIGETHPKVRREEGERYRNRLKQEIKRLGLEENVKFYNRYLTLNELIDYLLATDIYLCTNLDPNQIVSGTLSYAMGCGKAIISTPGKHAIEALEDEKGVLVEFKNPETFEKAILKILSDKKLKLKLENNSYAASRIMTWPNVAARYLSIFNKVVKLREEVTEKYPKIKLNHLRKLTDDFGCIQFSKKTYPDLSSGYTLDDNARALVAATLHNHLFKSDISKNLLLKYLEFIEKSEDEQGLFKNNFKNENEILNPYSEDAIGRTILATGYTFFKSKNPEIKERSEILFNKSIFFANKLNHTRSRAFAIIGLSYYLASKDSPEKFELLKILSDSLVNRYEQNSSEGWNWFEDKLTYANSKIPESLFLAYKSTGNPKYLEIAESSFKFLSSIVFEENHLSPVGESGWCKRNGERAFFDQQPIDTSSMVQTCLIAYELTKKQEYYDNAVLAFNWFLGRNHLGQMMYDETTGGCYDGLSKTGINLNQGAESTIAYLTARLFLEEYKTREINK